MANKKKKFFFLLLFFHYLPTSTSTFFLHISIKIELRLKLRRMAWSPKARFDMVRSLGNLKRGAGAIKLPPQVVKVVTLPYCDPSR